MAIVSTVHGPMPGSAAAGPGPVPVRRRHRDRSSPSASAPTSASRRPRRLCGMAERGRVERRRAPLVGKQVGEAARRVLDRLAVRARRAGRRGSGRPRSRPAARARRARRAPPRRRCGDPPARGALHERSQPPGRRGACSSTATGSASRSSSRRQRATALAEVPQVGERTACSRDVVRARPQSDDARAVGEPQGPPVGAVAPLLHAGHRGRDEVPEEAVGAAAGRRNGSRRASVPVVACRACSPALGPSTQLGRGRARTRPGRCR